MLNDKPIGSRNSTESGLYSLRSNRVQPVQGPAPGVNVPAPPMMMGAPKQQQGDTVNLGDILLKGMQAYYGGAGQQGVGQGAAGQGATGQPQGLANVWNMLSGLFGGRGGGTVPSGSAQAGVGTTAGR